MKKQNKKNVSNKALFLKKNHKMMEREIEDSPIRLDGKVVSDKLLHIDPSSDTGHNDLSKKLKHPLKTQGNHSLAALRSFRFK